MKRASALLLAAAAMSAGTARAYVRTTTDKNAPVRWQRSCQVVAAHTLNPPPNLTPDLVVTASRAAAAAWTRDAVTCPGTMSHTGFELQIAVEDMTTANAANDSKNNLIFRRDAWPYEPSALAITTVFARQDTGIILDADVEINSVDGGRFRWGDLVAGIGTGVHVEDLQNTLTHEFGHLLGLDHNCFLAGSNAKHTVDNNGQPVPDCDHVTPEIQAATMFAAVAPGDTERRTLTADDMAGVCAIYPEASASSCDGGDGDTGTGCSLGGQRGSAAGLLLAGLLVVSAAGLRRFRRRG
jgi:hypothetical protein